MLRADLLDGFAIALAGDPPPAIGEALAALGARLDGDDSRALVYDARGPFATGGLRQALDQAWEAIHAVATGSLIPRGEGGKVILVAPRAGAGAHAGAAREGLVNLARTLSIEWARYRITTTAILPGEQTGDEALAALIAFLASPAGDYFSGCRFELGLVA